MEILPPKLRFDITALHCSREKVRKKGMQQRFRPVGSTPRRVRTVFFKAVMFPLHCYPHIVLLPRVSFPLLPSAHKEL